LLANKVTPNFLSVCFLQNRKTLFSRGIISVQIRNLLSNTQKLLPKNSANARVKKERGLYICGLYDAMNPTKLA